MAIWRLQPSKIGARIFGTTDEQGAVTLNCRGPRRWGSRKRELGIVGKKRKIQSADLPYPLQDWSKVEEGTEVEVQYPEGGSYRARVDAKSSDSGIIWVVDLNGHGRKMYGRWEGIIMLTLTKAGADR